MFCSWKLSSTYGKIVRFAASLLSRDGGYREGMECRSWSSTCTEWSISTSHLTIFSGIKIQSSTNAFGRLTLNRHKYILRKSIHSQKEFYSKTDLQKGFPQFVTSAEKHEGLHASWRAGSPWELGDGPWDGSVDWLLIRTHIAKGF